MLKITMNFASPRVAWPIYLISVFWLSCLVANLPMSGTHALFAVQLISAAVAWLMGLVVAALITQSGSVK